MMLYFTFKFIDKLCFYSAFHKTFDKWFAKFEIPEVRYELQVLQVTQA